MKIKIGKEEHRIVYIDYMDGLPHTVITTYFVDTAKVPYWRGASWDFFPEKGDVNYIRHYNSGSGGNYKELQPPRWADGYVGKYWLAADAKFKGRPKNAIRLKNPVRLSGYFGNKSMNPFKISEEASNQDYCDRCGHFSSDFCYAHKYDDSEGNARYIDDNSSAE